MENKRINYNYNKNNINNNNNNINTITPQIQPILSTSSTLSTLSCNDILTNKVKLFNKWYMVGSTKEGCNLDDLNKLGYKSFYYENNTNTYRSTGNININDGIWIIKPVAKLRNV